MSTQVQNAGPMSAHDRAVLIVPLLLVSVVLLMVVPLPAFFLDTFWPRPSQWPSHCC